jgi:hypothetical protein
VTFSEAVTDVDTADFTLTTTGVSGTAVTGVAGTGSSRTVTVSTGSGNGTIRLDVPATATINDLTANPLSGLPFATGQVYTVDKTAPSVSSSVRVSPSPTAAASVGFTVTFSESVTGVDAADFSLTTAGVTGAAVTGVAGTGSSRTVTVSTGTGDGTIRLNMPGTAAATDTAGNSLSGLPFTTGEVYTIDKSDAPETGYFKCGALGIEFLTIPFVLVAWRRKLRRRRT